MARTEQDTLVRAGEQIREETLDGNQFDIRSRIYVIRNQQVMMDNDLAKLYQVETKNLNKAMKRNQNRFPEDFCFQLTKEEFDNLRFQIGTSSSSESSYGGRRYMPYVYTEQGISMLASVLHSDIAVNVSINIMRTFVEMRRFITALANNFMKKSNGMNPNLPPSPAHPFPA